MILTTDERHRCPHCHTEPQLSEPVGMPAREPEAGDAALCAECGTLSIYGDDGVRRPCTPDEFAEMFADPRIGVAYTIYRVVQARRARRN